MTKKKCAPPIIKYREPRDGQFYHGLGLGKRQGEAPRLGVFSPQPKCITGPRKLAPPAGGIKLVILEKKTDKRKAVKLKNITDKREKVRVPGCLCGLPLVLVSCLFFLGVCKESIFEIKFPKCVGKVTGWGPVALGGGGLCQGVKKLSYWKI